MGGLWYVGRFVSEQIGLLSAITLRRIFSAAFRQNIEPCAISCKACVLSSTLLFVQCVFYRCVVVCVTQPT